MMRIGNIMVMSEPKFKFVYTLSTKKGYRNFGVWMYQLLKYYVANSFISN